MFPLHKLLLNISLLFNILPSVISFTTSFNLPEYRYGKRVSPLALRMTDYSDNIISRRKLIKNSVYITSGYFVAQYFNKEVNAYTIDEEKHIKLFETLSPSVCYISTEYKNISDELKLDTKDIPKGVGSGFLWDTEGHIVTNFHVINKVDFAKVTLTNKNGISKDYTAKLTGVDPDKDIAVLKISIPLEDRMGVLPITLSSNKDIKVGQYSFAIGNPFGLDHSFSMGIISAKNRELTSPTGRKIKNVIQTDAAVNPGNSGGPLVDTSGKLIGMNTAAMGMGVSSGVNFAVSVDTIKDSVDQIIKYGMVQRAILGISYLERLPTKAESEKSGIPYIEYGVIVSDVPKTSPAYSIGLVGIKKTANSTVLGDVIIGIDGYPIKKSSDLMNVLDNYKPGEIIKLFTLRGVEKKPFIFDVKLGSFKMMTFSGLENEKNVNNVDDGIPKIPLDIPLKDIAPEVKPSMPDKIQ